MLFQKQLQLFCNNANVTMNKISIIRNEQCARNYSNQKIIEFIRCIAFGEWKQFWMQRFKLKFSHSFATAKNQMELNKSQSNRCTAAITEYTANLRHHWMEIRTTKESLIKSKQDRWMTAMHAKWFYLYVDKMCQHFPLDSNIHITHEALVI